MSVSQILFEQDLHPRVEFRTGISLHGHTLHSKESLLFLYRLAQRIAPIRFALEHGEARYRRRYSRPPDLSRAWWTPPLSAHEAWNIEVRQLAEHFGLAPLVSLSDHDNIDAPILLQHREECRPLPVSVEWTVPYGGTFLHIGVHNLPLGKARAIMADLAAYTAQTSPVPLADIFQSLAANRGTLIVFNHPNYDENKIGEEAHRATVRRFSACYKQYLHAFELNGLRPWAENRTVVDLARHFGKPIVAGGDRHGLEPNALLNLSNASTFPEFVEEIREGYSQVLIARQYMEPLAMRVLQNLEDILRDYDRHLYGKHWSDRVFYVGDDGVTRSFSQLWDDTPLSVRLFTRCVNVLRHPRFKQAFRMAFAKREAVALPAGIAMARSSVQVAGFGS
ncbi:MAG TPA: hypothetical protein VGR73_22645 [Bryobacteraceae bacterium]|nr:hypothetical protein [Bryobacteraceae bacterium]